MSQPQFPFAPESLVEEFRKRDPFAGTKTDEQRNIETVQRLLTALSGGDLEGFAQEIDPEMELDIHCPDFFPWIRHAKGTEEVLAAVRQNFGVLAEQVPVVTSVVAQGDTVDIHAEETGLIHTTGTRYRISGLLQYKLRDGKVVHVREIISDQAHMPDV